MSYVGQNFPPCDIDEVQTFSLDFSAILIPNEEIISAVWGLELGRGIDANPNAHLTNPAEFTEKVVYQQIDWSAGQNAYGNVYIVSCTITTSEGNEYIQTSLCEMAKIYTAPLSPVSLAERIRYKFQFASAPYRNISNITVSTDYTNTPPGFISETDFVDDEASFVIWWPYWVEEITIIIIVVVYDNGDVERIIAPIEVIQPEGIEAPNVSDVCANVYEVAPWDKVNIP